jgi:uncharacterized protein YabE (DUF348 family)
MVLLLVSACQSPLAQMATVVADGRVIRVQVRSRSLQAVLSAARVELADGDRVLERGQVVDPGTAASGSGLELQVRRAVPVLLNGKPAKTAAWTVGELLQTSGVEMYAADLVSPPSDTAISPGLIIAYEPSMTMRLNLDGTAVKLRSTANSVEAALADAGLPIIGLDATAPEAHTLIPEDSIVSLTRVSESLVLSQDPVPFEIKARESPEVELGLEQVLEPGQPGLAVERTRIRYQDGIETARTPEASQIVRPPRDRQVVRGTKIVEKTANVDGQVISYWRTLEMYATVYSPCNSDTGSGSCSGATASGLPAGKGVVAVDPAIYSFLNGQRLYIPGYGYAVIGDVGGGYIIEQKLGISRYKWIDLGFSDRDIQDMTGWITVYFLSPAPASIPDVLK